MAGKTVQLYELCTKDNNQVWSPFCWRAKLACLHKGLKVETKPWRFTEKERLKFANSDKVPVLVDGEKSVKESYDIAIYLEKTYPDAPSLFAGKGGQATCRLADSYGNAALMQYFPILLVDIWKQLDKADADYFREDREKMFGGKLEDVAENPEEKVKNFREFLEPLRMMLAEQPFVGGDQPNYGDYSIASAILTGRVVSKVQLLEKGDPVLNWLKKILSKFEDELKDCKWQWELP